jgi:hypothetical protein
MALGTVMCDAAVGSEPRDEEELVLLMLSEARSTSAAAEGLLGEGVHRSGLAVWASRVSKGKNRRFGRPGN